MELPEDTGINDHAINLEKINQLSFGPIYSLELMELEILKTYIKVNLTNSIIESSKSPIKVLIFFYQKPDENLCLCMDYQDLNNLTIKNR